MKKYRIFLAFLLHLEILAYDTTQTPKFSVFASVGPNPYLNNFDRFQNFLGYYHYIHD